MAELRARPWAGKAIFLALALMVILYRLMPFSTEPLTWPRPDLLLALTLAHAARRPDHLPVLLVACVYLLADLLLQRPPGLMTALVVIGTEALRRRSRGLRRSSFMAEWASVALVIAGITVSYRIALLVLLVPVPPLGPVLIEALGTALIYAPLALAGRLFGLARAAPGAVDHKGQRI